eukprot:7682375-Pyramimonas_sp.AAC.2
MLTFEHCQHGRPRVLQAWWLCARESWRRTTVLFKKYMCLSQVGPIISGFAMDLPTMVLGRFVTGIGKECGRSHVTLSP